MEISIPAQPLISVILAVRDASTFLPQCLESLLFQNYSHIEIIAIDDFSHDNSLKILQAYKKADNRIKVFQNVKKYGLAITLNRAIRRAKGKFVVFMDPRDTITKNKFTKQLEYLRKNPKAIAVGTQCLYINEQNKRVGKSNFPEYSEHISQQPLHGVSVLFEGIMVNRYRIPKDLLYFPTNKQFFLYSDMTMKLMQYGELVNLPEFLHAHRKHDSSLGSTGKHLVSLAKLWVSSKFNHDSTPPLFSFFSNALKPSTQ